MNAPRLLVLLFSLALGMTVTTGAPMAPHPVEYQVLLDTIHRGYDGQYCWVHPRAGIVPRGPHRSPSVVLTMQRQWLKGSDVFDNLSEMRSDNLGRTWMGPYGHPETLGERTEPDGRMVVACDFWPQWHAKSGKLLAIGHTGRYTNVSTGARRRVDTTAPGRTVYSVYDPEQRTWSRWAELEVPDPVRFYKEGSGSVQRVDLPNGDILLPTHFKVQGETRYRSLVMRCRFDGVKLSILEIGGELTLNEARGFVEPSLAYFAGRYFLTLRADHSAYVTTSRDGLNFDEPRKWTWDDNGTELGSYNTQQHWVTHQDGLFLVYTRRGASNDHVIRHRAPLFIAQVDPEKLTVIRSTERILVPDRGARLGNFGVTEVSPDETWVVVAEWMQTFSPQLVIPVDNARGADNSVYAARILWAKPNTLVQP